VTPAGALNHSPVHITDFMPTLLAAAGATYPRTFAGREILPAEGESFLPALQGRPWARQTPLFWEHEGNCAVRQGPWKLVRKYPGPWELYHMEEDRTELNDLAAREPDRVQALAKLYEAWAARCDILPWEEFLARRRQS
jgi:arylsulfatase